MLIDFSKKGGKPSLFILKRQLKGHLTINASSPIMPRIPELTLRLLPGPRLESTRPSGAPLLPHSHQAPGCAPGRGQGRGADIRREDPAEGRSQRGTEVGILGSGCFTQRFSALLNNNVFKFLKLTIYDNLLNLISKLLNTYTEDFFGTCLNCLFPTLGDHARKQRVMSHFLR